MKKSLECFQIPFKIKHRFNSFSKRNVLRGMHFQNDAAPQEKIVTCIFGEVYDVLVDIRPSSPLYGKTYYFKIGPDESAYGVYIPHGFAHGFLTTSKEGAVMQYYASSEFNPKNYHSINPFDVSLNIQWGINRDKVIISEKDLNSPSLSWFKGEIS